MLNDKYDLKNKNVLIMGLGRFGGGLDAAIFSSHAGANVRITDMSPAEKLSGSLESLKPHGPFEFSLGEHKSSDFQWADYVIANPAVPPNNQYIQIARQNGAVITSQIALFFQQCPAIIIGITGANGKSTTTALTAHLLENAKEDASPYNKVFLGGNIGNRPLLTTLDQIKPNDLVVLEISSFQLEQLAEIEKAPHIALLTNLTPNHLDRHGTFENYCQAKENIFKFQKPCNNMPPVSVFNVEDEIGAAWFNQYSKDPNRISIPYAITDVPDSIKSVYTLPGPANLSDLAGALAIARYLNLSDSRIQQILPLFKALPHRLEFVREIAGVRWYNDSIATTPPSAIAALEAFDCPIILIAGGYDKKLPFDEMGQIVAQKAKAVVLIGCTAPKIADAITAATKPDHSSITIEKADSLAQAVEKAHQLADPGDAVLLSPACASYDMFENFQQRGNQFAALVGGINEEL